VGLRWEHLDLGESPRVEVHEQLYKGECKRLKSSYGRRDVPLSPALTARLLAHCRDTYQGSKSPVFASKIGTKLLPANAYRRVLSPAVMRVGL